MPGKADRTNLPKQPMAEVFGYRIDDMTPEAERYRSRKLCPYNNKVPNCTKVSAKNPLGVCSVYEGQRNITITCPVRFREKWRIVDNAASFFFSPNTTWTTLTEVRLLDADGRSAGNIDIVVVAYDAETGHVTDFGSLEVQGVYISGNIRACFDYYMENPAGRMDMNWRTQENYPRPDYLSSSRKRLAPQLLYKGGILHAWGKKQAVAVDSRFFSALPSMDQVDAHQADLAWLIYDLQLDANTNRYELIHTNTVYTAFSPALDTITRPAPGSMAKFVTLLQNKLNTQNKPTPIAPEAPPLQPDDVMHAPSQESSIPPEEGVGDEDDDFGDDNVDTDEDDD